MIYGTASDVLRLMIYNDDDDQGMKVRRLIAEAYG